MSSIAKIFQSGNSQAVRLPKEFRFDVTEVEVSREGDAVILRPKAGAQKPWSSLRSAVDRGFSEDFLAGGRDQPAAQERSGLDKAFD